MQLKTLIYSDDPKWIKKEIGRVEKAVRKAKNVLVDDFKVEEFKPELFVETKTDPDGDVKMTWEHFAMRFSRPAFKRGYNVVVVHITEKTQRKWGVSGFNGVYRADPDAILECMVIADEGERSSRSRTSYLTQFQRVLAHEILHGFERWIYGTALNRYYKRENGEYYNYTHYMDYVAKRVDQGFEIMDMAQYRGNYEHVKKLTTIEILLREIIILYSELLNRMLHPVEAKIWEKLTQAFGEKVTYTSSGIHNGSDHGAPIGTAVIAWARNFEVYETFNNHKSLGNAANIRFQDYTGREYYARIMHLQAPVVKGFYKKGSIVGRTGNTGLSTGPHLHIEIWKVPIDIALLKTKSLVLANLEDPVAFFNHHINRS